MGCPGTSWSFSRLPWLRGQAPWALGPACTGVEASRGAVGSSAGSPFSWRERGNDREGREGIIKYSALEGTHKDYHAWIVGP